MGKDNSFIEKIFKNRWTPYWVIVILGLILYFQAFFFSYSYLDDNVLILGSSNILSSFSNIFHIFQTDAFNSVLGLGSYYRPIPTLSFMFDYHFGAVSPFIYHFTNVWLHILATSLLFIFLKKLDYRKELALLFSIIFLIHPVLTQAVAWIPGRNDSLLAIFILCTFIFFIKYLRDEKWKNLFWSLIFFGLAIFTKESGLFIIPVIIFYIFFIFKEKKLSINKFYFLIGSVGIIIFYSFLRDSALSGSVPTTLINVFKSVYFSFPAVVQVIGKVFLPFNLSVYPIMKDITFLYGYLSIILLAIILFITKNKRWSFILFGFFWFFAFLLPSFIRLDISVVANFSEHRFYLPIIGIFIILLETDLVKNINLKKKSTLIIIGGLILILSIITIIHSTKYVNRISFWKNAVSTSPSYAFNHNNLGAMYYLNGDMGNAEKEFKTALILNSKEPMAHNNLGLIYTQKGNFEEAEKEYRKEIEINPYYDNVYFNLGLLYSNQKRYDEAITSWEKTLEINPNYVEAVKALFTYYYENKNYEELAIYASKLYYMGFTLPPDLLRTIQLPTIK